MARKRQSRKRKRETDEEEEQQPPEKRRRIITNPLGNTIVRESSPNHLQNVDLGPASPPFIPSSPIARQFPPPSPSDMIGAQQCAICQTIHAIPYQPPRHYRDVLLSKQIWDSFGERGPRTKEEMRLYIQYVNEKTNRNLAPDHQRATETQKWR